MADQVGSVTVQLLGGQQEVIKWGTRVWTDRKGNLHITGGKRQHRVVPKGDWKGYLATPPATFSSYYPPSTARDISRGDGPA